MVQEVKTRTTILDREAVVVERLDQVCKAKKAVLLVAMEVPDLKSLHKAILKDTLFLAVVVLLLLSAVVEVVVQEEVLLVREQAESVVEEVEDGKMAQLWWHPYLVHRILEEVEEAL